MDFKRKIFIGSRNSNLARRQTSLAIKSLFNIGLKNITEKYIVPMGDRMDFKEFRSNGGKGLFTKEIDNLLINKNIDLAVHSAKDIPAFIDDRITIAAYLPREDSRDVFITKNLGIKSIFDVKKKIKFGSSSPRRVSYLKSLFPSATFINLRGNIESRIKKVRDNDIEATLLANAGIKRLKLEYSDINFIKIPTKVIMPSPGQGAIALMCRKDDKEILNICKQLDHSLTRTTVSAERAFIKKINGDCFTPLAALAKINENNIEIRGRLFSSDGKMFSEAKIIKNIKEYLKAGEDCAKKVLENF